MEKDRSLDSVSIKKLSIVQRKKGREPLQLQINAEKVEKVKEVLAHEDETNNILSLLEDETDGTIPVAK